MRRAEAAWAVLFLCTLASCGDSDVPPSCSLTAPAEALLPLTITEDPTAITVSGVGSSFRIERSPFRLSWSATGGPTVREAARGGAFYQVNGTRVPLDRVESVESVVAGRCAGRAVV